MALGFLAIILAILTAASGIAMILQRRLVHSVIFLAVAAAFSSFIFLYLNQVLVALLQLLVFVGGLSTYLIVAVASEVKRVKIRNVAAFFIAAFIIVAGLMAAVFSLQAPTGGGNDFSAAAQNGISTYYPVLFISVFLLFAAAIGSVIVIKRFTKLVV